MLNEVFYVKKEKYEDYTGCINQNKQNTCLGGGENGKANPARCCLL